MRFVTIGYPSFTRAGLMIGNEVLEIAAALKYFSIASWSPESVTDILNADEFGHSTLIALTERFNLADSSTIAELRQLAILRVIDDTDLMSPIPKPGCILLGGLAYRAHIAEMAAKFSMDVESLIPEEPQGFFQSPNALVGHRGSIVLPESHSTMVDFEGELALVVGKTCHRVGEAEAMDYIAGYTLLNDVSARDWNAAMRKDDGSLDYTYIRLGKQFPTFCPVGPCVVTKDELPDPGNIEYTLSLNGKEMQRASTSDLVHPVPRVLSHFSQWHVFQPGDMLSLGAPPGVGYGRDPQVFLRSGDVVEMSFPGLGVTLRNTVGGP